MIITIHVLSLLAGIAIGAILTGLVFSIVTEDLRQDAETQRARRYAARGTDVP